MAKKNKYYQPQKDKKYLAGQNIFHYDDDDYDDDGNLKTSAADDWSGSFYDDDGYYQGYGQTSMFDYDYESYSRTNGASSSWWRSKFKKSDYRGYSSPNQDEDPNALLNRKLSQELKEIARTVNAVRNTKGALNRERNLKVAWSGSSPNQRWGRNSYRERAANNISNSPTIHLSPDPLTDNSKIKPEWTEDQRRDALIGEALTLTSMKKTLQPTNVKKIMEYEVEDEVIRDLPLLERKEQEKAKLRMIARELWKSLETYKAQAEMLQEYRGSRNYFSAYLAFYSDKGYRDKVQEMMDSFAEEHLEDDVTDALGPPSSGKSKYKKSMVAAHALSWNVNHANINNDQVEPKTEEMEDVMIEAFDVLMDGVNLRSTFQRWEAAVQAAEILNTLDEDDDEEDDQKNGEKITNTLGEGSNNKNGNSDNLFGKGIENKSDVNGFVDCKDLEDEKASEEDVNKGLTDLSKGTSFTPIDKASLLRDKEEHRHWQHSEAGEAEEYFNKEWEQVTKDIAEDRLLLQRSLRYLRQVVEPYAQMITLPEYGLRSGRLSGNALWKVPTQLLDNDRVFHRNHVQGETQDVSVALMMDYSGSMGGASYECQRRIALLLHELFSDFPMVDFHMYGHESWYTNQVYGLTSIETTYYKKPNGGTNEGTALARTAQEFLAVSPKKNRKVILTMGDGHSNQEEIKKSVKMIRKAGIEVYDILIDGDIAAASESYGAGKAVVVASNYYYRECSSIDFDNVGLTEDTPQEELIQAQVVSIIRPWLASIFSKMQFMGAI